MLHHLHLRNLAVLAEAVVEFRPGLNVLSGETGAGKSIVVDALMLLAGTRASSELIRTDAETLVVTGVFEPRGGVWKARLAEAAVAVEDRELVVRREINRDGRNRVFVNDQPATVRLLADLAPELLAIHGQRDEMGLLEPAVQRRWLDRAGGAGASRLLAEVGAAYERYRELASRLARLEGDEGERLERIDLLRFQLQEIDSADLLAGEEEELTRERETLRHAEAIGEGLGGARRLLSEDDGAVTERLRRADERLREVSRWEPRVEEWLERLDSIQIEIEELVLEMARRDSEVEADPSRLDGIERRLADLQRLFRKYGDGSEAVLTRRDEIARELDELEVDEEDRERLRGEVSDALEDYRLRALELSEERRRWGERLAERIVEELEDLAMPEARLEVELERVHRPGSPLVVDDEPADFGPEGVDRVRFSFSPNPGEEPRSLSRIASGGELSRVYLALQLAIRGEGEAEEATMVFDEVDVGVGGRQAAALGKKLRRLAEGGQILAVTHLPQVASCAHHHFRIRKRIEGGRTFVDVAPLGDEERIDEVARMLAGRRVTDASRSHARDLIESGAG